MIPPFVSQIVGVLVRAAVVWVAGYLAANAKIELSEDQITQVVAYIVPTLAVLAWSVYSKYLGRQKLLTATAVAGATEAEIEQMVADPTVVNPSVLMGKNDVPGKVPPPA